MILLQESDYQMVNAAADRWGTSLAPAARQELGDHLRDKLVTHWEVISRARNRVAFVWVSLQREVRHFTRSYDNPVPLPDCYADPNSPHAQCEAEHDAAIVYSVARTALSPVELAVFCLRHPLSCEAMTFDGIRFTLGLANKEPNRLYHQAVSKIRKQLCPA